ncbi:MAG TPA: nucleotide sugar dehydrogenase, partial [bacterium]|nr:nucleotide sugar dehydrogenase [bacterium]
MGLPLSIALAHASPKLQVTIQDVNARTVEWINNGRVPFKEEGSEAALRQVVGKNLAATTDKGALSQAQVLIVVIGTPIDEFLNPTRRIFDTFMREIRPHLRDGQTLILRSTVFPGTSAKVLSFLRRHRLRVHVSYCPERIAEGKAMEELHSLPQIVSGFDPQALATAKKVFGHLTKDIVELPPEEAELA